MKSSKENNYKVTVHYKGEISNRKMYQDAPDKITAAFRICHRIEEKTQRQNAAKIVSIRKLS